jgi:DDE superfamily endonuclease
MRNYTQDPDRACGAPGARKRARRVREAVRGNGPADKAGTAPRIDFTVHRRAELRAFTDAQAWLRVFRLPAYAPDLNPVEGIWSVLKGGVLANLAVASFAHLVQVIRHGLKKIQYRPGLIEGCLAGTGLTLDQAEHPTDITN